MDTFECPTEGCGQMLHKSVETCPNCGRTDFNVVEKYIPESRSTCGECLGSGIPNRINAAVSGAKCHKCGGKGYNYYPAHTIMLDIRKEL